MSSSPVSRRRALGLFAAAGAAVAGLVGSVRYLGSPAPRPRVAAGTERVTEAYGGAPRQTGEWWVPPDSGTGLLPTVVLVHGGYWRAQYDASLEHALAADLSARGYLVWNLEYRASDAPWPATLTDVALGYDHLGRGRFADRVDLERVAVVGHSAGGHLALWLASRTEIERGGPGALLSDHPGWGRLPATRGTAPQPALVVAQAPVAALSQAAREGLGGGAVVALMGGTPDDVPQRYDVADPVRLLGTRTETVLVHAEGDDIVPISQSEEYVEVATEAGDDSRLVRVPGGHFEHLDPKSEAIAALREALTAAFA